VLHTTTLNPETWQLVKALVDSCVDLPLSERARYLAENCPDTGVRAEVLSLLEAYEESERFLDDPRALAAEVASVVKAEARDSVQIGPYKLIAEIGRGGMGTVYRAFRDDDAFQIVVALKVVSRGMDSDEVLKRFRNERQILASLYHPYIARILDGGTTATGLPYFVMEYVDGLPLTKYCDQHRLSVSERLALFRKVCEAVAYAHQNLVLHRDLKPGNILVTPDGTPKLLDFGIAKIVGGSPFEELEDTATAFRMATPAYASPEQISGGLTGVASDVYSLGVLLYELLTGHPPYRLSTRDAEAVAQVIREREPTRASSVVGMQESIGGDGKQRVIDPHDISQKRGTTVEALRRRLRGDLDNIVSMALRKETQRRYGSVEQLSEDIRRHLEGMPVQARNDTCWYRSSKFISRHRVGLTATAAAVIALCATTTMAYRKANQLSHRISQDHKLASLFLVDIHDAIAKLPGSTPAREVLLSQSLKYLNELAHDASDDTAMHKALALAHERFAELQAGASAGGLGQASAALKTYGRAQEIREELALANPDDQAIQLQLAESYLLAAVITGRTGGAAKRVEYDRKALAILERLTAEDPKNISYRAALARAHTGIAYGLSYSEEWPEARKHFLKALELRKTLLEETPNSYSARRAVALIHYRLGVSYAQSRQPDEAMPYLEEALALQTALVEEERQNRQLRSDVASTQHFIAVSLGLVNRHTDALVHLDAAIAMRGSMLAEDDRDARTRSLLAGNYAERSTALLKLEKYRPALQAAERALELQNTVLALDPQGVPVRVSAADFHSRAGAAHRALGHLTQARTMYVRAHELYSQLEAEGHLRSSILAEEAAKVRQELDRLKSIE
jgi:non-specific serine/threonine protein kinase/serine/threonine-protein kinase